MLSDWQCSKNGFRRKFVGSEKSSVPQTTMKSTTAFKFKFIFVRYLVVSLAVYLITAFFSWLLISVLEVTFIDEYSLAMILAIALPVLATYIFLYPWFSLYQSGRFSNIPKGMVAVSVFTMVLPTLLVAVNTPIFASQLTPISSIEEMQKYNHSKFYKLSRWYADKNAACIRQTSDIVHYKGYTKLKFQIHIVVPVYNSAYDTLGQSCPAWIGFCNDTEISTGLAKMEEETIARNFYAGALRQYEAANVNAFSYLEREGNTDDYEQYLYALQNCDKFSGNNTTVLTTATVPLNERYIQIAVDFIVIQIICALISLTFFMLPAVEEHKLPPNY